MAKTVWRIEAWIHPNRGGSDYRCSWDIDTTGYSNTVSDIRKLAVRLISRMDSAVTNDFRIFKNGEVI